MWFAFEYPAFVARAEVVDEAHTPSPGTYAIKNAASGRALAVEDGNSADNTPLVLSQSPEQKVRSLFLVLVVDADAGLGLQWTVSKLPGTTFRVLTNTTTGSSATVFWPPEDGQKVVGSRSPARLDVTSAWALIQIHNDTYE